MYIDIFLNTQYVQDCRRNQSSRYPYLAIQLALPTLWSAAVRTWGLASIDKNRFRWNESHTHMPCRWVDTFYIQSSPLIQILCYNNFTSATDPPNLSRWSEVGWSWCLNIILIKWVHSDVFTKHGTRLETLHKVQPPTSKTWAIVFFPINFITGWHYSANARQLQKVLPTALLSRHQNTSGSWRPDCSVCRAEITQTLPSSETIYHFVTAMMRFGDETPKRPWLPWLRLVSLSAESQRGVLVTISLYKLPASDWHRILKTNVWCPLQVLGTDVQGDTSLQAIFTEPQDGSPAWTKLAFNIFQHGNLCRSMSTNVDDLNSREPTDPTPLSWAVGGVVAASALPLPRPAKSLEQFWQKGLNESPTSRPTCT